MKRNEPFNVLRDPNSWDKCPRAEAIVLTIGGFASAGAATAALGAFAYNAAILAVSAGLSLVTSWAVAALTPAPPTPKQSLLVNTRDAAAPQEQVYGEVRKGGVTNYYESTRGGSVLYQTIVLAAHEIESVEAIYVNDKVVTLSEDGYDSGDRTGAGWVLDEEFTDDGSKHEIQIFYHKGDQTSITDTFANSSVESLDSVFFGTGSSDEDSQNFGGAGQPSKESFVGNDMAYIFVRFGFNAGIFRQGLPLITARIKGKKVYDPRKAGHSATDPSTWEYSDNAALCIRDFLSQPAGLNDSEIDDAVIQVAANTSDELVPLAGGGSEPRYTINGVVKSNQSYGDVLQEMTTACAGTLFWGGGKWKLTVGAYNAPTKTLTLDDLRSGISLSTRNNLRDQFNRVQGVFTDASNGFIPVDYPPIVSEGPGSFTEQDGGVPQALDLDFPFTTSSSAAQRLAKMTLFRGREQMVFSADFGLNAFDVEVGEIVSLDMDRYGWTGKDFEVIGWNFNINGDAGDLRISMVLRETSEAAFDWDAEEEDIIGNDTTLTRTLDPVGGLTASFDGTVSADGTFLNGIKVDWNLVPGSTGYQVEWTINDSIDYSANGGVVDESDAITTREQFIYKAYQEILYRQPDQDGFDFYNTGGGSGLTEVEVREQLFDSPERDSVKFSGITVNNPNTQYIIRPVLDNTFYNIRVRAVNDASINSPWRSVTFDTTQDDTIPNPPTGLSASGGQGSVKLSWTGVTTNTDGSAASDIFLYAIYRGTSSNPTTLIDTTSGVGWSDVGLAPGTLYYYRIKAIDFSGNESAFSANANAETDAAVTDGVDGDDGDTIYTGKVYYQTLQNSAPSTPSATSFNASTGSFSGLTSNWSKSQIPLQTTQTAWNKQEWSSEYTAVVAPGNTSTTDITFTSPDGAVQITTDIESSNYVAGSAGWRIDADTGDAEFNDVTVRGDIVAGSLDISSGGRKASINPEGSFEIAAFYQPSNQSAVYILQTGNDNGLQIQNDGSESAIWIRCDDLGAATDGLYIRTRGGAGSTGADIRNEVTGGGHAQVALSSSDGGYAFNAVGGGYFDGSGDGYNPFTGVHIAMLDKTVVCEPGDILVDNSVIVTSISDSFTEVVLSSAPNQKGTIGVLQKVEPAWIIPPAFIDREETESTGSIVLKSDPSVYHDDYDLVGINAVGEGAINVCGESGDISKGDLIVTSSTLGKGMRQSDDIVRSYTVAKAREDVTFSSPTEVKMIACIYLCG